jgi:hypothetical protein
MPAVTNGYCTTAELKTRIAKDQGDQDDILNGCINAASRMIDQHTRRYFWTSSSTSARVFRPDGCEYVKIDDLVSVTTLKTDSADNGTYDTTWTSTEYQLHPINGYRGGITWPYTAIQAASTRQFPVTGRRHRVQVTGQWGWSSVPTDIREACLILASQLWTRKDSAAGVLGFDGIGAEVRVGVQLDPHVRMLLAHYVKVD